ncbi:hypothetical protein D3C85_1586760 [compost metagenome]
MNRDMKYILGIRLQGILQLLMMKPCDLQVLFAITMINSVLKVLRPMIFIKSPSDFYKIKKTAKLILPKLETLKD